MSANNKSYPQHQKHSSPSHSCSCSSALAASAPGCHRKKGDGSNSSTIGCENTATSSAQTASEKHAQNSNDTFTPSCSCCESKASTNEDNQRTLGIRLAVALVLFAASLVACELLALDVLLGSKQNALFAEFMLFAIPYLIAGGDIIAAAVRNIARGKVLDENFLMTLASVAAFLLVLFPETDPHMAEGAAIMIFYQVGELFERRAVGKSRRSVEDLLNLAPPVVRVLRSDQECMVSPDEVNVGEVILVKPGERIGLDGVVISGQGEVDTAALTGESLPRFVSAGHEALSGCINKTGVLQIEVSKPSSESMVARIQKLVEQSAQKKARSERFISRFARIYTPCVSVIAFIIALIVPIFVGDWASWIQRGVMFLVVSCPCALVISVPLSFFGGIGGASRNGVLVKGSSYLEALAKTDTIFFDKTGTLTTGNFQVKEVLPAPTIQPEELIACAAHLESFSNHPIAESIKDAHQKLVNQGVAEQLNPDSVTNLEELSGEGLVAIYQNRPVAVGNNRLMKRHRVKVPHLAFVGTCIHVAANGEYLGSLIIGDTVKTEAKATIATLHKLGVSHTIMLTGDHEAVAQAVANDLQIDEFHANLLPDDKLSILENTLSKTDDHASKTSQSRPVAFVGDGINDAPVLTRADVGIAMGALGSDAAIEAADVVLMNDNLTKLAEAIGIARRTMVIVKQNIVFALGVKFAVLLLALVGFTNLWLAVFADVGVAFLAVLNALRALQKPKV